MSKDLPYFKFYASEWQNGNITLCTDKAQSAFINICSYYWIKECKLTLENLTKRFNGFEDSVNELIDTGIIHVNEDKNVSIKFLDAQLCEFFDLRDKRATAGKKGGEANAKRGSSKNQPRLKQNLCKNKAKPVNLEERRGEKRREEKIKEEKIYSHKFRECSELLKKRILEFRQQKITDSTLDKWDDEVRLMVERDNRTMGEIKKLINECHDMPPQKGTGFTWRNNILSMQKLRLNWNDGKIYIGINGIKPIEQGGLLYEYGLKA